MIEKSQLDQQAILHAKLFLNQNKINILSNSGILDLCLSLIPPHEHIRPHGYTIKILKTISTASAILTSPAITPAKRVSMIKSNVRLFNKHFFFGYKNLLAHDQGTFLWLVIKSNWIPYFLLHISHPFRSKLSKIVIQFPLIPLSPEVNCARSKGVKPVYSITPKIVYTIIYLIITGLKQDKCKLLSLYDYRRLKRRLELFEKLGDSPKLCLKKF
ncbi:hypothetical protein BpHYR1_014442 [Brachionus plicatilis]|uniref:Uncharacterized protein n=1 Tax=Brachionus plicatilis TaxID=10195 RepID=A0A3M7RJY9_BRAPC|nr:hypothetical protein BpHYR1_014442 [Brachionus plicatilis]